MTLAEATTLTPAQLTGVKAIYEAAFPDELTAPFEDLFVDRLLVRLDDGEPTGLALVRNLGATGWTFLRYYAVGVRGRGVGSSMWADLVALLAAEGQTRLLWDVEDPEEPGISEEHVTEHRRRIVFYERLGGVLLPVKDYLPPHDDGHVAPLLLMEQSFGGPADASLRDLVEGVYLHRYGLAASEPAVRQTLAASQIL